MKVSRGANRARHHEFWNLQVSKLALLNPELYEKVRVYSHALWRSGGRITSVGNYTERAVRFLANEDPLSYFEVERRCRYLVRAFRHTTPAPGSPRFAGDMALVYGTKRLIP